MYSQFGEIQLARQIFDGSLYRNVFYYTSLLSVYCSNGYIDEAFKVFDSMPKRNDSAMISGYI